jgi:SAM-dependent methyltransferase
MMPPPHPARSASRASPRAPRNPDSYRFWADRYASDPSLGSGVGSKGVWKARKLDLLAQILRRHRVRRVVDLGCGDLQVLRDLPQLRDLEYVGIDFCEQVIARNRDRFPGLTFIHADLCDVETIGLEAPDLVICFDVLFHLQDADTYRRLCTYMFNSGARAVAFTAAVGRNDANGVNLWYRDFWQEGADLGLAYVRKVERPFRLPCERLVAVDLAEPGRDQPTEVVYVCSPEREAQLASSLGTLVRSGSSFDRAVVLWIGERRAPRFADPRIAVQPVPPLFDDYFFGNKVLLCARQAPRVVFLDADTFVLRPLDLLWDGRHADFLGRVGTAYEAPGWDEAAWAAARGAAGAAAMVMWNAGVLVFQNGAHLRIRQAWETFTRQYLDGHLPHPWLDPRMPEQWGLALALAASRVSCARLGAGDHAFGWQDEPFEEAVVLHTGIGHYARYALALGPDAAALAVEGAGGGERPADPTGARSALPVPQGAAQGASRTPALRQLAVASARLLLALGRLDQRNVAEQWRRIGSARRLLFRRSAAG